MENKNAPAFASVAYGGENSYMQEGLSKREYFAAQAIQGIMSNSAMTENVKKTASPEIIADPEQTIVIAAYAKLAVNIADAVLEKLKA